MLKRRILTGIILAPLTVLAILKSSYDSYALFIGVVTLLAAWEWSALAELKSIALRIVFVGATALGIFSLYSWSELIDLISSLMETTQLIEYSGIIDWIVIPAVLWWIFISIVLKHFPKKMLKLKPKPITKIIVGWFVLVAAGAYLTRLYFYGIDTVLYFFFMIWCADIAAYFAGKRWGKTKLLPEISPGKTVAGLYGALAVTILYAIVACQILGLGTQRTMDFILLSLLTVMFSVNGDLFESLVKRWRGVKDSGRILPGHGGILDRIDSLIGAVPIFYLGLVLMSENYL